MLKFGYFTFYFSSKSNLELELCIDYLCYLLEFDEDYFRELIL